MRRPLRSASANSASWASAKCEPNTSAVVVPFASIVGQLAGNHFLTVVEGNENLRALGEKTLWDGAQDIIFDRA